MKMGMAIKQDKPKSQNGQTKAWLLKSTIATETTDANAMQKISEKKTNNCLAKRGKLITKKQAAIIISRFFAKRLKFLSKLFDIMFKRLIACQNLLLPRKLLLFL